MLKPCDEIARNGSYGLRRNRKEQWLFECKIAKK